MADIPLLVTSENASSERRITPSWTIGQLKARLEPITGVPPSAQKLLLKASAARDPVPIEADDEEATSLAGFGLVPYAELQVCDYSALFCPFSPSFAYSDCLGGTVTTMLSLFCCGDVFGSM